MKDALQAIMTRRSTRKFQDRPVPEELLAAVIEAGRAAPSGGNNQTTHFIVIRNREILRTLAEMAEKAFAAMEIDQNTYKSTAHSILASKKGGYVFHYHAPVLILTANRIGYGNAVADSVAALENMMIAANALDLGSCYINQLKWLNEDDGITAYLRSLGLREDEKVWASLALGYAASEDGLPARTPLPRTGNPVTFKD
ncbi:MAG: nitroreductase [Clostridia bacterium]|nr:nitroreductase [Clostridia bacterium]